MSPKGRAWYFCIISEGIRLRISFGVFSLDILTCGQWNCLAINSRRVSSSNKPSLMSEVPMRSPECRCSSSARFSCSTVTSPSWTSSSPNFLAKIQIPAHHLQWIRLPISPVSIRGFRMGTNLLILNRSMLLNIQLKLNKKSLTPTNSRLSFATFSFRRNLNYTRIGGDCHGLRNNEGGSGMRLHDEDGMWLQWRHLPSDRRAVRRVSAGGGILRRKILQQLSESFR